MKFRTVRRTIRSTPYQRNLPNDVPDLLAANEKLVNAYRQLCSTSTVKNEHLQLQQPSQPNRTTDPSQIDNNPTTTEPKPIAQGTQNTSGRNQVKLWPQPKVH